MAFSIGSITKTIVNSVLNIIKAIVTPIIPVFLKPNHAAIANKIDLSLLPVRSLDSDDEIEQAAETAEHEELEEPEEEIYPHTHTKMLFAHAKALIAAAQTGDTVAAIELIDSGAPVNVRDSAGNSPLKVAIDTDNAELICALIGAGAYIPENKLKPRRAQNTNTAPVSKKAASSTLLFDDSWMDQALLAAVQFKNIYALKALINANANVNATDSKCNTALMIAVRNEDFNSVDALLKAGADLNAKNGSDQTVLTLATQHIQRSTQMDIIFRLLSAFSRQGNIPYIPADPLNSLAHLYRQKIMQIRSEVFSIVSALGIGDKNRRVLPRALLNMIISHPDLYPRWYHSQIQQDMHTIYNSVNKIAQKRQQKMLLLANTKVKAPKRKEIEDPFYSANQAMPVAKRRHRA